MICPGDPSCLQSALMSRWAARLLRGAGLEGSEVPISHLVALFRCRPKRISFPVTTALGKYVCRRDPTNAGHTALGKHVNREDLTIAGHVGVCFDYSNIIRIFAFVKSSCRRCQHPGSSPAFILHTLHEEKIREL